jgi:hypothetical protein
MKSKAQLERERLRAETEAREEAERKVREKAAAHREVMQLAQDDPSDCYVVLSVDRTQFNLDVVEESEALNIAHANISLHKDGQPIKSEDLILSRYVLWAAQKLRAIQQITNTMNLEQEHDCDEC